MCAGPLVSSLMIVSRSYPCALAAMTGWSFFFVGPSLTISAVSFGHVCACASRWRTEYLKPGYLLFNTPLPPLSTILLDTILDQLDGCACRYEISGTPVKLHASVFGCHWRYCSTLALVAYNHRPASHVIEHEKVQMSELSLYQGERIGPPLGIL